MKGNFSSLQRKSASTILGVLIASCGTPAFAAPANPEMGKTMAITIQQSADQTPPAAQAPTTQSKFYCNIKALNPEERARHKKLSEKLIAARAAIVETDKGYEFQFTPATMTLAELAEWSVAVSKCCPFLDFHLDLENEGQLLCLRLTGAPGVKPFIRAEFQVPAK